MSEESILVEMLSQTYDVGQENCKKKIEKVIEQIESHLKGVNIALDVLDKNDALYPKMEGAKDALEECLSIIHKYCN